MQCSETIRVNGYGNNNGMEVDVGKGNSGGSREKYNGSLQRDEIQMSLRKSKRLARQAQNDKEVARKTFLSGFCKQYIISL